MHYLGAVTVVVSLSDTGYVCAVEVVKGLDHVLDKEAVDSIRQQVFQPIRESGRPIPGSMAIVRDFWQGDGNDILVSENRGAAPDEIPPDARSFRAADVASLIKAGKVRGTEYRNEYFGLSLQAPGGVFAPTPVVDDQARNVRLVDAVVQRSDGHAYEISILADGLSNYPDLKSRAEYLRGFVTQLQRDGAKLSRDDFPYVISGVEFVGAILEESDGAVTHNSRGLFTAVMKGYMLTFDIAAASESEVLKIASSVELSDRH